MFTQDDGRYYKGSFACDKKEGYGIYYWGDGRSYQGQWKAGKQHGIGIFTKTNGRRRKGEWAEGKRIAWLGDDSQANNDSQ